MDVAGEKIKICFASIIDDVPSCTMIYTLILFHFKCEHPGAHAIWFEFYDGQYEKWPFC